MDHNNQQNIFKFHQDILASTHSFKNRQIEENSIVQTKKKKEEETGMKECICHLPVSRDPVHEGKVRGLEAVRVGDAEVEEEGRCSRVDNLDSTL
jgi:hypothetical protein